MTRHARQRLDELGTATLRAPALNPLPPRDTGG